MTDDPKKAGGAWRNEGEGSRSAARAYDRVAEKFGRSGKVEQKAREARDALDSPEGKELERAEAEGKSHSKGEDPLLGRTAGRAKP